MAAALLIFWPTDSDPDTGAAAGDAAGQNEDKAAPPRKGGIQARQFDDAKSGGDPKVRRNPAVKIPPVGMNPNPPPPSEPPTFETKDEERAYYEDQLFRAERILAVRKKARDRLEKIREDIEKGPNPEQQMATYESRKELVEENLNQAEKRVAEVKQKLEELGG